MHRSRSRTRKPKASRSRTRKPKNKKITSIQLTSNGDISPLDELFEGNPFFRKYVQNRIEHTIYKILKNFDHKNIVKIYRITDNYIDIELIKDDRINVDRKKRKKVMENVKNFLQKNNIAYIDWKPDNIGLSNDGTFKLYDFDASGIFKGDDWVIEPPYYYVMRTAPSNYTPKQIDDWSFEQNI